MGRTHLRADTECTFLRFEISVLHKRLIQNMLRKTVAPTESTEIRIIVTPSISRRTLAIPKLRRPQHLKLTKSRLDSKDQTDTTSKITELDRKGMLQTLKQLDCTLLKLLKRNAHKMPDAVFRDMLSRDSQAGNTSESIMESKQLAARKHFSSIDWDRVDTEPAVQPDRIPKSKSRKKLRSRPSLAAHIKLDLCRPRNSSAFTDHRDCCSSSLVSVVPRGQVVPIRKTNKTAGPVKSLQQSQRRMEVEDEVNGCYLKCYGQRKGSRSCLRNSGESLGLLESALNRPLHTSHSRSCLKRESDSRESINKPQKSQKKLERKQRNLLAGKENQAFKHNGPLRRDTRDTPRDPGPFYQPKPILKSTTDRKMSFLKQEM